MPITRIPLGGRVFAPSWIMTVLTIAVCVLFISLGRWQWERGKLREAQWEEFERGSEQAIPLGSRSLDELSRFQRVQLTGQYDVEHQTLLDNRSHAGRPGYEVLTPLRLPDGRTVLINRGWVPFTGLREQLPDIAFEPHETVTVTGRVDHLPVVGIATGRVAPAPGSTWPKVASFPTFEQLESVYGQKLEPRIVLLDADQPHGYVREWRPPGMEPERHISYAIQWWSFAALAAILWVVLSMRKVRENP